MCLGTTRLQLLCERYHNNESESRHSNGDKSTHSAVISTLEGNVLSIENRPFVENDAVHVVPDDSERTQQALAGADSPAASSSAAMPAQIRRFEAKSVVASEAC